MNKKQILEKIIENIELPQTAYAKAEERYKSIGDWLVREKSSCLIYEPHILPQGSFRLGTAIKPLNKSEDYDLDITCKFKNGITEQSHTQYNVKTILEKELESYRTAKGINDNLEEKRRCWRLSYADQLSFHMDIVPAIPIGQKRRQQLNELMFSEYSENYELARNITDLSVYITDNEHTQYKQIADDWLMSNPEGYALWFEERMKQMVVEFSEKAYIESLPTYARKNPLQQSIQLLKRHRDVMFQEAPDGKPISIIITTLSAKYYEGESNTSDALETIISGLKEFVDANRTQVLNPTNPNENFADKWQEDEQLKNNFYDWVDQLCIDFNFIGSPDMMILNEKINDSFKVDLGYTASIIPITQSAEELEEPTVKPWATEKNV